MKYSMSLCLIHPIDSVDLVGGVSVGGAMPCAEINSSFCVHGTCEMKNGLATCKYDPQTRTSHVL